jgi:phosphoglycolate phosphatase-like HAD superfamily hydrolase
LIRGPAGRGVRVVLATSAPEEELKLVRAVLDVEDQIHAVTSVEDVGRTKPDPGSAKAGGRPKSMCRTWNPRCPSATGGIV